jgi:hypothetical protein
MPKGSNGEEGKQGWQISTATPVLCTCHDLILHLQSISTSGVLARCGAVFTLNSSN